jgi:hypothetical protein
MQPTTLPRNVSARPPRRASSYPEVIVNHVKITTEGPGKGTVEIDGANIANSVRSLRLTAGVGEITELTLDVHLRKVAEFEGDAFVRLTSDFEDFLTTLGWRPPRRP